MHTYELTDLKPGMTVVFVDTTLNDHPVCWVDTMYETNAAALSGKTAMIIAVDATAPGKQVAACFKDKIPGGHSCDGRVPDGHGAYVLPSHLYSPEAHEAHKTAHDTAATDQLAIDKLLAGFVTL